MTRTAGESSAIHRSALWLSATVRTEDIGRSATSWGVVNAYASTSLPRSRDDQPALLQPQHLIRRRKHPLGRHYLHFSVTGAREATKGMAPAPGRETQSFSEAPDGRRLELRQ